MKTKPLSDPKKQTQNKPKTNPIQTQSNPVLSAVEWANFFKGQNRLPRNPATLFPSLWKKIIDMSLLL